MPLLAALVAEVGAGIISFLLAFFTQRVAIATVVSGLFIAAFAGLLVAGGGLLAGLNSSVAAISPMFGAGVQMVVSPRAGSLVSAYIGFWGLCQVFKLKTLLIGSWARAS